MTDWPYDDPFKNDGGGQLIHDTPTKRVWVGFVDGKFRQCTDELCDGLTEQNKQLFNDSAGQRWGDGRRVASIPLAKFWRDLMPAQEQGDQKYIKKWLNDSEHRGFRTFAGKV